MIRHAAALAVALLCLNPTPAFAQTTPAQTAEFTVKVQSATIHKGPSTGTPAVGRAPRGTVLVVTRDIGSWIKVSWPDAEDGVGFVHQSMGSIAQRATREERLTAALPPGPTTPATHTAPTATTQNVKGAQTAGLEPSMLTGTTYVPAPTHNLGLGGRFGGAPVGDVGVTARIWSSSRFGVQLEASRSAVTSDVAPGRLTSFGFAPSLVYSFPDHVTDNVWVRPYAGAGATLHRSTLKIGPTDVSESVSDSSFGFRTFGGAEITLPAVPRFAVSADIGYLWAQTPFSGFELGGMQFSVAGHWYLR